MDPQAQASFIPKKPLVASATAPRSGRAGIMWFVALLIFVGAVAAAAAAFFYEGHLERAIQAESESLNRAQAAYDPKVIEELIRLNNRINQSKKLLQGHLAPSNLFSFLEQNTLSSVRFTSFDYTLNPNGAASLTLSGIARDFPSVALQSDTFGKNRSLKDVLFSDVNIDPQSGQVVFKVSATVDESVILYRDVLSKNAAALSAAAALGSQAQESVSATTTSQ